MSKRKFRIGDLAEELNLKKFVVRYWEKEFDLQSDRSFGGQRYYTEDDLAQFNLIKDLLYNKGFTIIGARQQLKTLKKKVLVEPATIEEKITLQTQTPLSNTLSVEEMQNVMQPATTEQIIIQEIAKIPEQFLESVRLAKEKLLQIRKTLE